MLSSNNHLNRLSCMGENDYGHEQSRLYQINSTDDSSTLLLPIIISIFLLIVILSSVAIMCGCRANQRRKRSSKSIGVLQLETLVFFPIAKKLPVVYDAHYSINELIKDVGCLRTSGLRTCNTSLNDTDQLSLKIDQNRIDATGCFAVFSTGCSFASLDLDHLLSSLFSQHSHGRRLTDNLSNESSTNSSGFHSKSLTTNATFNNEYSPRLAEITDYSFPGMRESQPSTDTHERWVFCLGISPLYTSQYQMNV